MNLAAPAGGVCGLWLMAAPSVLGYSDRLMGDVHRVVGPVAASLALISAWEATAAVRWPNIAIGLCVVASPILGAPSHVTLATVATGIALIAATPIRGRRRHALGGGWRAVVRPAGTVHGQHRSRRHLMFDQRVVVVTGASAGVGRAIVRAFAQAGANVALLARNRDGLEAAAKEVEQAGGRAVVVPVDVADSDAVEAAALEVERELGPIDVWVNNAMTSVFAEFIDVSPDEFRRVTDVTYHGYVNGTRSALRRMLVRGDGVIVQVGSALAFRGIPLQSAYCGAKHAVEGFTESVRCELLHRGSGVRLGMIQLPAVNTPQFDWVLSRLPRRAKPVPPIYQPEPIARSVVAFAAKPRRQMWLGWATIKAILANRIAPGVLDRYLGMMGYASQQTEEPADRDRPSNLWTPLEGDWGAHGRFDAEAIPDSRAMWVSRHRRTLTWAAMAAAALGAAAFVGSRD